MCSICWLQFRFMNFKKESGRKITYQYLYLVRIKSNIDDKKLIKIGITSKENIDERFEDDDVIELIEVIKCVKLETRVAMALEYSLIQKYRPKDYLAEDEFDAFSRFGGYTEVIPMRYTKDVSKDIDAVLEDKAVFKPQDDTKATYANKILKSEARINWSESARNIIGKINGCFPNSFFLYKGERYKLLKAEPSSKIGETGNVLSDSLEIACKEGSIKVLEIQKEGKRPQKINEFMHGSQIKKGSNLNNA